MNKIEEGAPQPLPKTEGHSTNIQNAGKIDISIAQPRRPLPTANRVVLEKLVGWMYPNDFIADGTVDFAIRIITFTYNEQHGILRELADAGYVRYDPRRRGWQILPEPKKVW